MTEQTVGDGYLSDLHPSTPETLSLESLCHPNATNTSTIKYKRNLQLDCFPDRCEHDFSLKMLLFFLSEPQRDHKTKLININSQKLWFQRTFVLFKKAFKSSLGFCLLLMCIRGKLPSHNKTVSSFYRTCWWENKLPRDPFPAFKLVKFSLNLVNFPHRTLRNDPFTAEKSLFAFRRRN